MLQLARPPLKVSRVGSQRSSSQSSWFFAESQDGWSQPDSTRSWGTEVVTLSSEDWEGCSSVWLNQPSASRTSEFVSIGLERTSSSKHPHPLSPENDRQSWKRKYPADDTLLSSILVKYRKDYLEAPLPLTMIQNVFPIHRSHHKIPVEQPGMINICNVPLFTFPTYAQRSNSNSWPCSLIFPSWNCWSTPLSGTYPLPCWFMLIKLPSLKRWNIQRLRLRPFIMPQDLLPLKSHLVPTVIDSGTIPGHHIGFASLTSCVRTGIHGRPCFSFGLGTGTKRVFQRVALWPICTDIML